MGLREGVAEVNRLMKAVNPPAAVFYCPIGSTQTAFSYYHYEGSEPIGFDANEKDEEGIVRRISKVVPPGRRFVVLHHRSEKALFRKILEEDRRFRILSRQTFGETDVLVIQNIAGEAIDKSS